MSRIADGTDGNCQGYPLYFEDTWVDTISDFDEGLADVRYHNSPEGIAELEEYEAEGELLTLD